MTASRPPDDGTPRAFARPGLHTTPPQPSPAAGRRGIHLLTGEYSIILPLMAAIVLAAGASRLLSADTIYTLKLRRRGVDLASTRADSPLERVRVADAMRPLPDPLPADAPLPDVTRRLSDAPNDALPVVDASGALRGVVTAAEVEQAVQDGGPPTAAELARPTPALRAEQTLQQALTELIHHHDSGLPVISAADDHRVLGWLDHRDVLRALTAAAPDIDGRKAAIRRAADP